MGCDLGNAGLLFYYNRFNPRTHMGCDSEMIAKS